MQSQEIETVIPSEHLAKTAEGQWIKGVVSEGEFISIYWQKRTVVEHGKVTFLDENGQPEFDVAPHEVEWEDPWVLGGVIPFTDEMVEFVGLDRFELFCYAMMKYAVGLMARGFGDNIAEVVSWFVEGFDDRMFLPEGDYTIISPYGAFEEMRGCLIEILYNDDDSRSSSVVIDDQFYDIDLDDPGLLVDFFLSVIPV